MIELIHGDCLEEMKKIPDGSIDLVLTDPPYGTTACKWDTVIPFEPMWKHLKRVTKKNGAIVLFGSQPFTSALVMSSPKMFKYEWVWRKERGVGFQIAKYRPMMETENISVFCNGTPNYNPQMIPLDKPKKESFASTRSGSSPIAHLNKGERIATHRYPKNIIEIKRDTNRLHPTQKPVALMEYLIRTYTNEGETVLDFTMGSGTTMLACKNINRNGIGIELDKEYFEIAKKRINEI